MEVVNVFYCRQGLGRQESKEFTEKTEGRTAANKPKNRYRNILPCENNLYDFEMINYNPVNICMFVCI